MSLARKEAAAGGLTYEEYLLLPDDGRRHQLIGGEHFVTPAPTTVHQLFLGNLYMVLGGFVLKHQLGQVFFAPVDVVLSPRDVVQPDLIFLSNAHLDRVTKQNIQGAPDLVVEVVSEASRQIDRKLKRALYGQHDVLEYWMADPELRILEVYRRDAEGRLVKVAELEDDAVLTSPLLPGLEILLKNLWP
ncbi:MAG: Uma2 family endonuclease [Clostridia bacterium]|jgi:Uma2 family endonuclease|nr:Uma2 family endonuclease [Clostridia bacterium]MDH7573041.1 Uma2 family endonuclease [Clostridia bacterium]